MRINAERRNYTLDHFVIVCIVLAAIPITIYAHLDFLASTLLFFGVPSAYLIWRKPDNFKKAFLAGVILGLILSFSFDFVAEFNHAWGWSVNFTIPVTFFGVVSFDILIWYFLWVFLVVAYYEYFIEHDRSQAISPHAITIAAWGIVLAILTVLISKVAPSLLILPYAYAELGALTCAVCIVLLYRHPHLRQKVLRIIPFFAFMYLSYELTALYLGLWNFPGAYLGSVYVGNIHFPLEELLVWILASSAIVATYYEFCIDDGK